MPVNFQTRNDGSAFLVIDGDLQFDSRDERIYHESLVFPAVSLVQQRSPNKKLRILVCGGGDGLAAREILKYSSVGHLDLYDYDSRMIGLAKNELAQLNTSAFSDPRMHVYIDDCRGAVDAALISGFKYDAIFIDLIFPQNLEAARLHHVDSYAKFISVLDDNGLLAVNAVSPSRTPDAYWSIYNSIRLCGIHPRPFRICLPSFTARGYGKDWGFLLASRQPILREEISRLELPEPRHQLRSNEQLEKLFRFPKAIAERRRYSIPAQGASDILLHYCRNAKNEDLVHETEWDSLEDTTDDVPIPPVDTGDHLLPFEIRHAFQTTDDTAPVSEQTIFQRIIELMPSLNNGHTRKMIAEFLEDPGRFLHTIDFKALVDELLRRASELPKRLVAELVLLKEQIKEFCGDYSRLLQFGARVVTITAIVVIVGNLLSPDSVYGKGGESFGSFSSDPMGFSRPFHSRFDSFYNEPSIASGQGFRMRSWRDRYVDEEGTIYRTRYYNYCGCRYGRTPASTHHIVRAKAIFKLSPEADILPDGKVAIWLNDSAFLILNRDYSSLVDASSTNDVLELAADPAQLWRVQKEIERQVQGLRLSYNYKREWINWFSWLEFMPWYEEDRLELQNLHDMQAVLSKALQSIASPATLPVTPPDPAPAPTPGATELVSNIWILPDAKTLAINLPSGMAYMDDSSWYRDAAKTHSIKDLPYPSDFKFALKSILSKEVAEAAANAKKLQLNLNDANGTMAMLQRDLQEYNACTRDTQMWESVDYGSQQIPLREALERTNADINRCQQRIDLISKAIYDAPMENEQAQRLLQNWHFPAGPSKPPANSIYTEQPDFGVDDNSVNSAPSISPSTTPAPPGSAKGSAKSPATPPTVPGSSSQSNTGAAK